MIRTLESVCNQSEYLISLDNQGRELYATMRLAETEFGEQNLIARLVSGDAHKIRVKFEDKTCTDATIANVAFIFSEDKNIDLQSSKINAKNIENLVLQEADVCIYKV